MTLCRYLKEWRKNPQCSLSCCLAFLLPLNNLQGEIGGLAKTNAFQSQLQTGEMEMPTVYGAVKASGAIDVTFEADDRDVDLAEGQDLICKVEQCDKTNLCHQETQTTLSCRL